MNFRTMSSICSARMVLIAAFTIFCIKIADGFRPGAFPAARPSAIVRPSSHFRVARRTPFISRRYQELGLIQTQLLSGSDLAPAVVGDVMVGEVVEIGGTVDEPRVRVKLFGLNGDIDAILRTKDLSASELRNVVLGNVAEMRVIYIDRATGSVEVAFSSPAKSPRGGGASPSPAMGDHAAQNTQAFVSMRPTAKLHPPANGVLLKSLKCGTKLEGTVQSCTLYAAFVMANVYREATGGTWKEVNGMLHTSDIIQPHRLLPKRMGLNSAPTVGRAKLGQMSIEAGTKLTVYVKDVFPNSGRFTLTTDPDMSKSKLALIHRQKKEEATARKQSRRLRRLFETLKEGDVISGTVHSIVPEGVLISVDGMKGMVSSPSAFAMKGLIKQKDLPTQFEVPGPLSSAICVEMLRQDFYPGRRLQCSVLGINPKVDPRQQYQLILLYESFEPEDEDVPRSFFKSPEEEEEEEEEEGARYAGQKNKAGNQLKRGDGDDWGEDYSDSDYSDGDDDAYDFESGDDIKEDDLDGVTDEEVRETDIVSEPPPKKSPNIVKPEKSGSRLQRSETTPPKEMEEKRKSQIAQSTAPTLSEDKSDSTRVGASDTSVSHRHENLFAELCDKNGFVTCRRIKDSEYVKLIVQSGQLTIDHVNKIILSCIGTKKTGISLGEFASVMTRMEETIRALASRNRIKSTAVSSRVSNETESGQRRPGGRGANLFDDPEILEDAEITFELLRGSDEYLSVAKLKEWTYLKDMMKSKTNKDGKLTPTDVDNAIMLAYSDKFAVNSARIPAPSRTSGKLNKDQFLIFLEAVDKFLNGIEVKLRDYFGPDDDDDDGDEGAVASSSAKTARNKSVSKAAASPAPKATNKSTQEKNSGSKAYITSASGEESGDSFDEAAEDEDGVDVEDVEEDEEDEDGYFDEEDEEFDGEAAVESLYDLLRGPQDTLTVKALCEWDFIQLLIKSGQLQSDALNKMVKAAVGNSTPSTPVPMDKFKLFMEDINVIAENMESIESEDI